MQELTKEMKLTALVLATKGEPDNKDGMHHCALKRANLYDTEDAIAFGFSEYEQWGIMDGWDAAMGQQQWFRAFSSRTGYQEGFVLGQKLYRLIHDPSV